MSKSAALPDPDEVSYLDGFLQNHSMNGSKKLETCDDDEDTGLENSSYILGTLIVKVIAARDIRGCNNGGLAGMLFNGSGNFNSRRGSANVYGALTFSTRPIDGDSSIQIQRTTTIFNNTNPVWPRHDNTYYFDVSLPVGNMVNEDLSKSSISDKQSFCPVKLPKADDNSHKSPDDQNVSHVKLEPMLCIKLFHTVGSGRIDQSLSRYPSKKKTHFDLDDNDILLGGIYLSMSDVITGKSPCFDEWIQLENEDNDDLESSAGEIRVSIEYEPTDQAPRVGDLCRLTSFCEPMAVFPIPANGTFLVDDIIGGDLLLLSYSSIEGWLCNFCVHRNMVICAVRHQAALELYREEIVSMIEKLSHSHISKALHNAVQRVPDDGLLNVGIDALNGTFGVMSRWVNGGMNTVLSDVIQATNWDGKHAIRSYNDIDLSTGREENKLDVTDGGDDEGDDEMDSKLPRYKDMPSCPITGESMRDPVVAADGHTYERNAIIRWLCQSDKSPLTGKPLLHKELVTNYSLISQCSIIPTKTKVEPESQVTKIKKTVSDSKDFVKNQADHTFCNLDQLDLTPGGFDSES